MSDSGLNSPTSPSSSASLTSSVLTPRRKVRALLAQFSDSDSGSENPIKSKTPTKEVYRARQPDHTEHSSDEEDVLPPSRLAARLMPETTSSARTTSKTSDAAPVEPLENRTSISLPATDSTKEQQNGSETSDEELIGAVSRRQYIKEITSDPIGHNNTPKRVMRSNSPLFFSSPDTSPRHNQRTVRHDSPGLVETSATPADNGRSKFLALVAKHRKERLAREAAEIAQRAAGLPEQMTGEDGRRTQRGSSPADGSSEDSDDSTNEATKRITKEARPVRKASKKALEEMNRETQRMSRNMQLAHQARTKKKVTKESLLARFNFLPTPVSTLQTTSKHSSTDSSSSEDSSTENAGVNTTPPTSPIPEPQPKEAIKSIETDIARFEMHGALVLEDALPEITAMLAQGTEDAGQRRILAYVRQNRTVLSPEPAKSAPDLDTIATAPRLPPVVEVRQGRASLAKQFKPAPADSDSGSDVEIVTARGSKRKYAAFETLSKRKANETQSHVALRSLAHLMGGDDQKRSMNAAEMEAALRQAARTQALQERRQRLEELKAKGIVIQTAEERERDQQEVEDLVERARQEANEIQKREKELAKKDGTYVKDNLDDEEDDSADEDFEEDLEEEEEQEEGDESDEEEGEDETTNQDELIDGEVDEAGSDEETEIEMDADHGSDAEQLGSGRAPAPGLPRSSRRTWVVSDDEEDDPELDKENVLPIPSEPAKTPQSVLRSARKVIPGLQMSDDLPMGLSQAFAATMAESQSQNFPDIQDQDSLKLTADLPSPRFAPVPALSRLDSVDLISDSQPASQTQPLNVNLSFQPQQRVPESPIRGLGISGTQFTPSQAQFDLTQDGGYLLSPYAGSRFAETPNKDPQSTVETVVLPVGVEDSPILQRKGRLRRGRGNEDEAEVTTAQPESVFQVMKRASEQKAAQQPFEKSKSNARAHFDEAAEESEDEYAGLGGASDDDGEDEENEEDRRMIDEDTQVGRGDEAKLAGLYADRERERDEKEVSKLLKDITTGALRRKRGVGDDLDLSDEEDEAARRREAKRREFARMRRELLKDEAVGKIAEDKKKEAFLRSIEDREAVEDEDEDDFDQPETQAEESQEQGQSQGVNSTVAHSQIDTLAGYSKTRPLDVASDSQLNRQPAALRRTNVPLNKKPATLAEIRESVSFLIEEPDSQAATVDLGLSDSEDEPEAYVNLDRHFKEAEDDENALDDDADDLGGFIIDDEPEKDTLQKDVFKKPDMPHKDRAPYSERRTQRPDVVDRLSLLRQSSSSSMGSNASNKMAFFNANSAPGSFSGVPSLLRRATTNSSLGSVSGRETVSATDVTTHDGPSRTERGSAGEEKEFIRKGSSGRRTAVNYQVRATLKEEKMSERAGIVKASAKGKKKGNHGFLGGLFRGNSWE